MTTMLRSSTLGTPVLAVITCLVPTALRGQEIPSPYRFFEDRQEVEIFAGSTGQETGRFGFGPKSGLLLGARYGIQVGGPFGLEGVVGYNATTRDVVDPSRPEGNRVVGEVDANLMSLDARLRFSLTGDRTWRNLNPFLFLGAGVIWDLAGGSEADELVLPDDRFDFGARFLTLFGGGTRWFLTDRILIRADLAISLYRLKTPRGYFNTARGFEKVDEKEWVGGPTFSISAGFHF